MIKYPEIQVKLVGEDGNAFSILARVKREMRHEGVASDQIEECLHEMRSGDYDNLLRVVTEWVTVV